MLSEKKPEETRDPDLPLWWNKGQKIITKEKEVGVIADPTISLSQNQSYYIEWENRKPTHAPVAYWLKEYDIQPVFEAGYSRPDVLPSWYKPGTRVKVMPWASSLSGRAPKTEQLWVRNHLPHVALGEYSELARIPVSSFKYHDHNCLGVKDSYIHPWDCIPVEEDLSGQTDASTKALQFDKDADITLPAPKQGRSYTFVNPDFLGKPELPNYPLPEHDPYKAHTVTHIKAGREHRAFTAEGGPSSTLQDVVAFQHPRSKKPQPKMDCDLSAFYSEGSDI